MKITTKGRYAIHILYDLAVNGAEHTRGFQGGYRLTKPLGEYVIGDVLRLTEGSLAPVECLSTGHVNCPKQGQCATIILWEKVDQAIRDVVDNVTLADLVAWQQP